MRSAVDRHFCGNVIFTHVSEVNGKMRYHSVGAQIVELF
jgi:hypothetical protein